jgi:hypothetical protein
MEVKIRAFLPAGILRGELRGRNSATGSPRRSITIMPPSEASRTSSEVWMWSSRTEVFLIMLHCSTSGLPGRRVSALIYSGRSAPWLIVRSTRYLKRSIGIRQPAQSSPGGLTWKCCSAYCAAIFSAISAGGRLRESYTTGTTTFPRLSMYPHFPPVIVRCSSPGDTGVETHPVQTTATPCPNGKAKSQTGATT